MSKDLRVLLVLIVLAILSILDILADLAETCKVCDVHDVCDVYAIVYIVSPFSPLLLSSCMFLFFSFLTFGLLRSDVRSTQVPVALYDVTAWISLWMLCMECFGYLRAD